MLYNVLFPSGRVLEFGTLQIANTFVLAYNGTLLPQITLDKAEAPKYNDSVEMMN